MNKKIFFFLFDKNFIFDYFFRLSVINFFGLLFLYDTDSFNQGLISVQSIFYSINSLLTFLFLIIEFTASILQFYGLDYKFLKLIFLDIKSINPSYVFEILITILNYVLFIILISVIIFFKSFILKNFYNKKFIFFIFVIFISLTLINIDFSKKFLNKIYNFNKNLNQYSFFRNDNWFLYYKYQKILSKNKNLNKQLDFVSDFSTLIDPDLQNNVFIIINESYRNFKNHKIKNNLLNYIIDDKISKSFKINNYITDWSREYSTQGAELKLFCGNNSNFNEFKKKNLKDFINDNECYFKNFDDFSKIFIHSFIRTSFNRNRYESYFDNTFFYKDLDDKELEVCVGRPFTGYCDHQLIEKMNEFKITKKNLVIYLTVNNHIPVKLIRKVNEKFCKANFPLNINEQFCSIYQNQILFNKGLNKLISSLSKDDFLIYYSDTPPIFPKKHRIHFEDYIDVYTFKKK